MVSLLKRLGFLIIVCPALFGQANIPSGTTATGYIQFNNISAPSTPASGKTRLFADSTLKVICSKNDAGSTFCGIVYDTGATSHQFLTAIIGGVISRAQPAFSDLSGSATCAQLPALTGDTTTSAGSCATSTVKVNGGSIPASATALASDSSGKIIAATYQGNGSKVQLSTGSTTTNDCTKFDGSGNVVDAGVSCGATGVSGAGYLGLWNFTLPPSSGWTWDNQGTSTIDSTYGWEYLHATNASGTAGRLRYRTANSTPYSYNFALLFDESGFLSAPAATGNTAGVTVGFRDGSGKLVGLLVYYTGTYNICVGHWTSATSIAGCVYSVATFAPPSFHLKNPMFLEIKDDGTTNVSFNASIDGKHWYNLYSESRTSYLGSGPTQIYWGAWPDNMSVDIALVSMETTSP